MLHHPTGGPQQVNKNTQVMLLTGQISNSQQIKQQTTMAFQPESKKLAEVVRLN